LTFFVVVALCFGLIAILIGGLSLWGLFSGDQAKK